MTTPTLSPLPILLQTNAAGEHLDNVDLHLSIYNGVARIMVYAIISRYDEDGLPQDVTSDLLLGADTLTDLADFKCSVSLKHLDDVVIAYNLMSLYHWMSAAGEIALKMLEDELPVYDAPATSADSLVAVLRAIIAQEHPALVEHSTVYAMPSGVVIATRPGSLTKYGFTEYFWPDHNISASTARFRETLASSYVGI